MTYPDEPEDGLCSSGPIAPGDWLGPALEELDVWTEDIHRAWYRWAENGDLCWLCDDCVSELSDRVSHASEDDLNDACWRCGR